MPSGTRPPIRKHQQEVQDPDDAVAVEVRGAVRALAPVGEHEQEVRDAVVRDVSFVDGFSFKYSPRPGTAAEKFADAVPEPVAQARLEEVQALLREHTLAAHRARVGERTEVLVEGPSRQGGGQLSGRDPYHRVVNFAVPGDVAAPAPGELRELRIVEATPHSLIGEWPGAESSPSAGRSVKQHGKSADEKQRSAVLTVGGADAQSAHPGGR